MIGASHFWSVWRLSYESCYAGPGLVALAPRLPAVATKLDAKRKAAPKGEAVILAGKAKGLAKAKPVGDNAVAQVLPVACGLLGGGPVLRPLVVPAAEFYLICLCRSLRSLHQSPMSHHLLQKEFFQVLRCQPFTKGSVLQFPTCIRWKVCTT